MMKVKRLSLGEFALALKRGHGRALLHVREFGDSGMEGIIEHALTHSVVNSDSDWLMNIVICSGNVRRYAQFLSGEKIPRDNSDELFFRMEIAANFHRFGFSQFRDQVLDCYKTVAERFDVEFLGYSVRPVFEVSALGGLDLIATTYGANPHQFSDYECLSIFEEAERLLGESEARKWMTSRSRSSDAAKQFFEAITRERNKESPEYQRPADPDFDYMFSVISANKPRKSLGEYRRFSRVVTAEQLRTIFSLLMRTDDPRAQGAYLRLFSWCELPRVNVKVVKMLDSPSEDVAFLATLALSRVSSPRVRSLARDILQKDICRGLTLLRSSYQPADAVMVLRALMKLQQPDEINDAAYSVRLMAERSGDKSLRFCMLWAYENDQSNSCRIALLELLAKWKCLPERVAFECQWDEYDCIRNFAREWFHSENRLCDEPVRRLNACPSPLAPGWSV